jgi:2,3-bisphosphoglycerate-independent phosphoglycerate mutase
LKYRNFQELNPNYDHKQHLFMNTNKDTQKLILLILDGWGIGKKDHSDAIHNANTPFMKSLEHNLLWSKSRLDASGEQVGLPSGQMGNSEVGHLNIGAGRIVYQDFVRINNAVHDNSISNNEELNRAFTYAKTNKCKVHYLGLVSDGGVHASTEHLKKLCQIGHELGISQQFVHVLTDGRDTDPYSGLNYVEQLDAFLKTANTRIASVCGRYYTMDRDNRWGRVKKGYDLLVHGKGVPFRCAIDAIKTSYQKNITDEFIEPAVIVDEQGNSLANINANDVVICFNFRTDRLREITQALTQKNMSEHGMNIIPLHYVTMTRYDEKFSNIHVLFDNVNIEQTLGEIISNNGLKQIRIAETEKYPHVSFFFSGGREEPFEGEKRMLIPSPKVATYDLQPSMSAIELKDAIIPEIESETAQFICLNFANADMVGHTGVYDAIVKALETVDKCVEQITLAAIQKNYSVIIIADHGNADNAINDDGSPNTAHSLNQVPCFIYHTKTLQLQQGRLSNIAPTILKIMGIQIPQVMDKPLF